MRRTRKSHECNAHVRLRCTAVENLGYTNDGTGEVDIARGLSVHGAMRLDLKNEVGRCLRFVVSQWNENTNVVKGESMTPQETV